jgi:hypothetical protein
MMNRVNEFIEKLPGDACHESVRDNTLDVIRGRCLDASGDGTADREVRRRLDGFYAEQRLGRMYISRYIFSGADRT